MQWYLHLLHDPFRLLTLGLWIGLFIYSFYKRRAYWRLLIALMLLANGYASYQLILVSQDFLKFATQTKPNIGHTSEFGFVLVQQLALLDFTVNLMFSFGLAILAARSYRLSKKFESPDTRPHPE